MKPATFSNQKLPNVFPTHLLRARHVCNVWRKLVLCRGTLCGWVGKAWEGFRWFRWFRWPRTQGIRWHGSKWRSQRLEHLTSWLTAFSVGSKSRLGVLGWWSFLDLWDTLTSGKCLSVWVFGFGCCYAKFALSTAKCRSFAKKTVYRIGFAKKVTSPTSPSFGSWNTWHFLLLPSAAFPRTCVAVPSRKCPTPDAAWDLEGEFFWNLQNKKITKIYNSQIPTNSCFFGDFKKFCKKSSLNISDTRFHLKIGIEFSFPAKV